MYAQFGFKRIIIIRHKLDFCLKLSNSFEKFPFILAKLPIGKIYHVRIRLIPKGSNYFWICVTARLILKNALQERIDLK